MCVIFADSVLSKTPALRPDSLGAHRVNLVILALIFLLKVTVVLFVFIVAQPE